MIGDVSAMLVYAHLLPPSILDAFFRVKLDNIMPKTLGYCLYSILTRITAHKRVTYSIYRAVIAVIQVGGADDST